ncbi:hypothetical protein [Streptomyces hygroscopicus]|uniref:hypothetical protein n=2 Tax=Streptomyces hygroscopicus TaxID=1912 RepID=UPI0036955D0C
MGGDGRRLGALLVQQPGGPAVQPGAVLPGDVVEHGGAGGRMPEVAVRQQPGHGQHLHDVVGLGRFDVQEAGQQRGGSGVAEYREPLGAFQHIGSAAVDADQHGLAEGVGDDGPGRGLGGDPPGDPRMVLQQRPDQQRIAPADRRTGGMRRAGRPGVRVVREQFGDTGGGQRAQPDAAAVRVAEQFGAEGVERGLQHRPLVEHEEDRLRRDASGQGGEELQGQSVGVLDVVDPHDEGALGGQVQEQGAELVNDAGVLLLKGFRSLTGPFRHTSRAKTFIRLVFPQATAPVTRATPPSPARQVDSMDRS